jgi:hypothetical protein
VVFTDGVAAMRAAQRDGLPPNAIYASTAGYGDGKALQHLLDAHPEAVIKIVDDDELAARLEGDGRHVERVRGRSLPPLPPTIASQAPETVAVDGCPDVDEATIEGDWELEAALTEWPDGEADEDYWIDDDGPDAQDHLDLPY